MGNFAHLKQARAHTPTCVLECVFRFPFRQCHEGRTFSQQIQLELQIALAGSRSFVVAVFHVCVCVPLSSIPLGIVCM